MCNRVCPKYGKESGCDVNALPNVVITCNLLKNSVVLYLYKPYTEQTQKLFKSNMRAM